MHIQLNICPDLKKIKLIFCRTWAREREVPRANLEAATPEAPQCRPGGRHQPLHHHRHLEDRQPQRGGGAAQRLQGPRLGVRQGHL